MKEYIIDIIRQIRIKFLRMRNHNRDVTIISQNCIGGFIYHNLGLEFNSPTVNMYIEGEDFVKLVENPRYYFEAKASVLQEDYRPSIESKNTFPIVQVGDIKLYCMHYRTGEEAINAWKRRCARVNYDKIYVIACAWNLGMERKDLIDRVLNAPYKNTVVFSWDSHKDSRCIQLDHSKYRLNERQIPVPALTDMVPGRPYRYFEECFDYVGWLNNN